VVKRVEVGEEGVSQETPQKEERPVHSFNKELGSQLLGSEGSSAGIPSANCRTSPLSYYLGKSDILRNVFSGSARKGFFEEKNRIIIQINKNDNI
jgi:hypothetical protein